jgi:hypothetical protein
MSLFRQHEIEDRGGSAHGSLNGTTLVEIVPAPDADFTRVVESIRFVNKDSAAVDIRTRKTIGGSTHYEFDNAIALAVSGKLFPVTGADTIRLTDTDQSITAVMGAGAATTNPTWIASWRDVPVAT